MAEDPLKEASLRVFFAIPFGGIFGREIEELLRPLTRGISGVRWVDPEQVHLTLHFFGSVPANAIKPLHFLAKTVAALFLPFGLALEKVGVFPSPEHPNIIWLGIKDPSGRLLALQKAVQREVRSLGYAIETRPFLPHITIGRVKKKSPELTSRLAKPLRGLPTPAKIVDHFVLYQSRCFPEGARYEILKTYALQAKV